MIRDDDVTEPLLPLDLPQCVAEGRPNGQHCRPSRRLSSAERFVQREADILALEQGFDVLLRPGPHGVINSVFIVMGGETNA